MELWNNFFKEQILYQDKPQIELIKFLKICNWGLKCFVYSCNIYIARRTTIKRVNIIHYLSHATQELQIQGIGNIATNCLDKTLMIELWLLQWIHMHQWHNWGLYTVKFLKGVIYINDTNVNIGNQRVIIDWVDMGQQQSKAWVLGDNAHGDCLLCSHVLGEARDATGVALVSLCPGNQARTSCSITSTLPLNSWLYHYPKNQYK